MLAYSKARAGDAAAKAYAFTPAALTEYLVVGEKELDARVGELCRKTLKRPLILPGADDGWILCPWLSSVEHDPATGSYVFRLQPRLVGLLSDLRKRSLIAPLDAYLRLEGKYSQRILELLLEGRPKSGTGEYWELEVSIDEIRNLFELSDTYKKAKALKKWVIVGAVTEINLAELGYRVEVETTLQGKKTKGFRFKVRRRGGEAS